MLDALRRKLPRSSIAWFAAAAVAATAAWLVTESRVAAIESMRPDLGTPAPVVVAADDLARGATLAGASVGVADLPSSLVPPGAVTDPAHVEGRRLVADVAAGEVITSTRLAGTAVGPVAALVPPGLRAFVLPAGPPAGTIAVGDRVDVLATYGANAGRPYTETVATALEVLDVVRLEGPATSGSDGLATGPPLVVVADTATVERLARAASLAIVSVAIIGAEVPDAAPTSSAGTVAGVSSSSPQPTDAPSP